MWYVHKSENVTIQQQFEIVDKIYEIKGHKILNWLKQITWF